VRRRSPFGSPLAIKLQIDEHVLSDYYSLRNWFQHGPEHLEWRAAYEKARAQERLGWTAERRKPPKGAFRRRKSDPF
jgi:hypothetical protein